MDLYCERCSPAFWAEPLNASTNASFLIAAFAAWVLARRHNVLRGRICLLIALAASVGVGSFLFHTFATHWAMWLDVIPILIFELSFIWIYSRTQLSQGIIPTTLTLVVVLAASLAGMEYRHVLNGSLMYAPAFVLLLVGGGLNVFWARHGRWQMLAAAGVFLLALSFRTIDLTACSSFPTGTHFLWHLLNGLVIFLAMQGLILNDPSRGMRRASQEDEAERAIPGTAEPARDFDRSPLRV